ALLDSGSVAFMPCLATPPSILPDRTWRVRGAIGGSVRIRDSCKPDQPPPRRGSV
ncbi:MAG: hypothetical protein AVDCRST_MAG59-2386, partial [uncultured Thermomicrobiales bacterium]